MVLVKERDYNSTEYGKYEKIIQTEVYQFNNEQVIKLKFLSSNSSRKQGVGFMTDKGISIKTEPKQKSVIVWNDERQSELILKCSSGFLNVFNVWEEERIVGYHDFQSGMRIKNEKDVYIYSCNDAYSNGDFTSLVFSIQIL